MKTIDVTQLCNPLRVALKHSAIAIAVAAGLGAGSVQALPQTTTSVIALGPEGGGTSLGGGARLLKISSGTLPVGSLLRRVSINAAIDTGDPYVGDIGVFFDNDAVNPGVLRVCDNYDGGDTPGAVTEVIWDAGYAYYDGAPIVKNITVGIPPIDLNTHSVYLTSGYSGKWFGTVTLEYDIGALAVALNTPADAQGYPAGTSITATATVLEPVAGRTHSVTFHTTPINPAGSIVDTPSTDLSSPFSADLGALDAGTYEIYATVANNADPAGTATSPTRTFTVAAAIPTTTTIATSVTPTTYGQNVTFTATVSPTPAGGTVQFYDGVDLLGSPAAVNTSTGEATYSSTTLGAGAHDITASFSGYDLHEASPPSDLLTQVVDKAPLTVRALNMFRAPNTANPDPFPTQITGYQNGQGFANSGVTGTPELTTDAILSSPAANYVITCALGSLVSSNYSFTLENGTLTVAVVADTFSVNFYVGPDWPFGGLTTDEQKANLLVGTGVPAGLGDWFTSGWRNFLVPWAPAAPLAPVTLTSNKASTATFTLKDCRNGWTYNRARTTLLGDGNGNMMDGHVNSTLDPGDGSNLFDMEVTSIPFAVYDVIFYIGANLDQFGDGTGVIVFNGGAERAFTLKPGAFDGTFTEMVDATTQGNYIVFKNVTGASFTTKTWGTGPTGFNHIGPNGFQIREAAPLPGYAAWAASNAPGQTPGQDFDNDGVDNGLEYFMGQTGSSFTALPGLDATNTVTWPKDPAYNGTWQVQTSPDLAAWTNVAGTDNGTSVSYTLPTGLGTAFVRLLATPTP